MQITEHTFIILFTLYTKLQISKLNKSLNKINFVILYHANE